MNNINTSACRVNDINARLQISTNEMVDSSKSLGVNQLTAPSVSLSTGNGDCNMIMKNRLIKLSEVKHLTGLSRSSIYQYMKDGTFPKQTKTGLRGVAWFENQIHQWINSRIVTSYPAGASLCGN